MYDMDLRIGDNISVYKANMIIPQIAENKAVRNKEKISFDNYKKVMIYNIIIHDRKIKLLPE